MKKTVRLSDIAERLQVSTVTVSNALAGQKGVSEELRARIKQAAALKPPPSHGAAPQKESHSCEALQSGTAPDKSSSNRRDKRPDTSPP